MLKKTNNYTIKKLIFLTKSGTNVMIMQNMDNQLTMIAMADAYARSDWKNISPDNIHGIAPRNVFSLEQESLIDLKDVYLDP